MNIQADFLFVDPPYAKTEFYQLVFGFIEFGLLAEDGIIICEHDKQLQLPDAYGDYMKTKHVVYGSISISIYKK